MGCGHGLVREINSLQYQANQAQRTTNTVKRTAEKIDKALGISEKFNLANFRESVKKQHNEFRSRHGCPELQADEDLAAKAQQTADNLARNDKLENSDMRLKGEEIGESIAMWNGDEKKGEAVVAEWYDQKGNFNWEEKEINRKNEGFAQVVWKSSSRIGVGIAKSSKGNWFVVVNYSPGIGRETEEEIAENVPRCLDA